jgi:hypothetical protein
MLPRVMVPLCCDKFLDVTALPPKPVRIVRSHAALVVPLVARAPILVLVVPRLEYGLMCNPTPHANYTQAVS